MTGQITYDAHTARLDDFHRRAGEHRRATGLGTVRRRRGRFVALIRGRRTATTSSRSATSAA